MGSERTLKISLSLRTATVPPCGGGRSVSEVCLGLIFRISGFWKHQIWLSFLVLKSGYQIGNRILVPEIAEIKTVIECGSYTKILKTLTLELPAGTLPSEG